MVLQRHFNGVSCIAVAFFGAVRSVFLDSLSVRGCTFRWLLEVEKVVSRGPRGVISSVSMSQSDRACVSWRRVVWLVSMSQSDQLEVFLVELCSARVDDPIQPAGVVIVCFFFFWL